MAEIKGKSIFWVDMSRYDQSRRLVPVVIQDDEAFTVFWATERMFSDEDNMAVLQGMAEQSLVRFKARDRAA